MAFGTITSANAALQLSVAGVFSSPVQIQGFGADDAFTHDAISPTAVEMGVDGFLAGGFTYVPRPFSMMLLAASPSVFFFDQWYLAMLSGPSGPEALVCNGSLALPSVGKKYTMSNGFLTSYKPGPDGKKMLTVQPFTITFQSIIPSPTS